MTAPDLTRAVWRKSSFSTNASNCVEVAFVDWRKSSFSTSASNCVEVAFVDWRKSSLSSTASNCVEVAFAQPHLVAVRDSKNTAGPTLAIPTSTWHTFLAKI